MKATNNSPTQSKITCTGNGIDKMWNLHMCQQKLIAGESWRGCHVYYVMEAIAFCEVSVRHVSVPVITTPLQCVVRRMFYPVLHSVHVCTVGLLHLLHEQSDSRLKKAMV
jgi:hypothetical protein